MKHPHLLPLLGAAIAAATCTTAAHAVTPEWGIRAAIDVNIPGKWSNDVVSYKMFRPGVGATLGGVSTLYLTQGFFIQPGVSLFYDSYAFDDLVVGDVAGGYTMDNPSLYKLGLRIPLTAGYMFDFSSKFSMCVYTGPEFSWAFAGKIKYGYPDFDNDPDLALFNGFEHRVDLAWKFGIGVPVGPLLISADWAIGMTNILNTPDISCRENRVSLAFTYNL